MRSWVWYQRFWRTTPQLATGHAEPPPEPQQADNDFRLDGKSGLYLPGDFRRPFQFGFQPGASGKDGPGDG